MDRDRDNVTSGQSPPGAPSNPAAGSTTASVTDSTTPLISSIGSSSIGADLSLALPSTGQTPPVVPSNPAASSTTASVTDSTIPLKLSIGSPSLGGDLSLALPSTGQTPPVAPSNPAAGSTTASVTDSAIPVISTIGSPYLGADLSLNSMTARDSTIPVGQSDSTIGSPPLNLQLVVPLGISSTTDSASTVASPPLGADLSLGPIVGSPASSHSLGLLSSRSNLTVNPPDGLNRMNPDLNIPLGVVSSTGTGPSSSTAPPSDLSQSQVPKRKRALEFPMTKITIGDWTKVAMNLKDLVARCYFHKKQFVWDIMDNEETEEGPRKRVKKMEMSWEDVLSHRVNLQEGSFEIELGKPPIFKGETDPLKAPNTVWENIDQFAPNHTANICRRHKIQFDPETLKKNYSKIMEDAFWSTKTQVSFPSLDSLFFGNENVAEENIAQDVPAEEVPEEDEHRGQKRKDLA